MARRVPTGCPCASNVSAFPVCGLLEQFDTSSPLATLQSVPYIYANVVRTSNNNTTIKHA
eukprot:7418036-Pyramimonas_sp.AAC.1